MVLVPKGKKWGWGKKKDYLPSGNMLVCVPNMLMQQWQDEAKRMLNTLWRIVPYPTSTRSASAFWMAFDQKKEAKEGRFCIVIVAYSVSKLDYLGKCLTFC